MVTRPGGPLLPSPAMRILVVSDVHANLRALDAVIEAAGPVDGTWHLGDVVGYGPDPDAVVARLRQRARSAFGAITTRRRWAVGRSSCSMSTPAGRWNGRSRSSGRTPGNGWQPCPSGGPRAASRWSTAARATRPGNTSRRRRSPARTSPCSRRATGCSATRICRRCTATSRGSLETVRPREGSSVTSTTGAPCSTRAAWASPATGSRQPPYLVLDLAMRNEARVGPGRLRHRRDAGGDARGEAPRTPDHAPGRRPLSRQRCVAHGRPGGGPARPRLVRHQPIARPARPGHRRCGRATRRVKARPRVIGREPHQSSPTSRLDRRSAMDAQPAGMSDRRPQGPQTGRPAGARRAPARPVLPLHGPRPAGREAGCEPAHDTGRPSARPGQGGHDRAAAGQRGGDRRAPVQEEGARDLQLGRHLVVGLRDRGDPAGPDPRRRRRAHGVDPGRDRDRRAAGRGLDLVPPGLPRVSVRRRRRVRRGPRQPRPPSSGSSRRPPCSSTTS